MCGEILCSTSALLQPVCVLVYVYLTVSKYVYLHAWMNSPQHHTQLLHVPQAVAVSTVSIRGHRVQQQWWQVFICLSCHHMLIWGDDDTTVLVKSFRELMKHVFYNADFISSKCEQRKEAESQVVKKIRDSVSHILFTANWLTKLLTQFGMKPSSQHRTAWTLFFLDRCKRAATVQRVYSQARNYSYPWQILT